MGRGIVCIGRGGLGKAFESKGVFTFDREQVDITDIHSLNAMFAKYEPVYVINCAGFVGTGKCEHEPENANFVNVGGVANIVYMCKKYNSNLIHISTIYASPYNTYTHSKLMAEHLIRSAKGVKSLIVRVPWIFGRFTENFILNIAKGKKCQIFPNETGFLAYDEDICDYVINSVGNFGAETVVNDGEVTREEIVDYFNAWDFVKKIDRAVIMPNVCYAPTVRLRSWVEAMEEFKHVIRSSKSAS